MSRLDRVAELLIVFEVAWWVRMRGGALAVSQMRNAQWGRGFSHGRGRYTALDVLERLVELGKWYIAVLE
jgi:hypothetical protein